MLLPVRGSTDPTLSKTIDSNVAPRNLWAEAFKTLDADDQKQFDQLDTDLLGVLATVSKNSYKAGKIQWLAQVSPDIFVPIRSNQIQKTTKSDV
jgi:hypothetical protein